LEDQKRLKKLPTLEEKGVVKRSILDTYQAFINDYLSEKHNYPNDVAVQVMIWSFDVLDIELALKLAIVLIEQKQLMHSGFGRDMPTFVCDAIYDWASDLLKARRSASPYLDQLVEKLPVWAVDFDLHPAVVSKCYVMLAKHKAAENDYQAVLELCDRAKAINPEGHGCKTLRETAARLLAAA
jgi:hypothetical protein